MREGEVGDDYYAVVDGTLEVTIRGRHRREMGRGEGFGEIALLADVPRTATVAALTEGSLLVIERGAFRTAVTGRDSGASGRVGRGKRAWHPELDKPPEVLDPPGEPTTDPAR